MLSFIKFTVVMMSLQNKTLTKKLVPGCGARPCCLSVEYRLWIRKTVDHFMQGLMGHSSRNMEDSGAEVNVDYGSLATEYWLRY